MGAVGTNKVLKQKLLDENRWSDFVSFRTSLVSAGNGPATSQRQAERAFANPAFRYLSPVPDVVPEPVAPISVDVSQEASDISSTSNLCVASDFEGREASPGEISLWVARNILNIEATKESCPDGAAWAILQACKSSPGFASDFLRTLSSKTIPNKLKEVEEEDENVYDGLPEVNLCAELLAAAKPDAELLS